VKTSRSGISTADAKKIPAEWPVSKIQPRAHDPKRSNRLGQSGRLQGAETQSPESNCD
jgi:hypothetical protein